MSNDWIIEVLRDLQAFAALNNLPDLETQLGVTLETAISEIAANPQPLVSDDRVVSIKSRLSAQS